MDKIYVEQHDGGYWVAGTRISLDSIVYSIVVTNKGPQTANLDDRILQAVSQIATLEGLIVIHENRLDLHRRFKESWRLHTYQGLCERDSRSAAVLILPFRAFRDATV